MRISDWSSDVCSSDLIITDEPDRVGEGFTLGPVPITSIEGIRRTALIQPGSLYESKYRIRIAPGAAVRETGEVLKGAFPAAGFDTTDRALPDRNSGLEGKRVLVRSTLCGQARHIQKNTH